MIRCKSTKDSVEIHIDESKPLQVKHLLNLIGSISGRGEARAVIDGQLVHIVIGNDGTSGGQHTAIDE